VVFEIVGQIDRGDAANAEDALDAVTVGESGFEALEEVRHGCGLLTVIRRFSLASWPRVLGRGKQLRARRRSP
jgi:hypothetical protein